MGEEREEEMNKKIYPSRSVETQPLEREILVHGAMLYECECCGRVFQMWLEKGLEDRKQDAINPSSHKPVSFCIGCLCGGTAKHIAWQNDICLDEYRPLKENENYFENTKDKDYGVSHFRNNGSADIESQVIEKFIQGVHWKSDEEREQERQAEEFESDFEDDPYGLAHISTSTLKSELRRRKRWK